MPGGFDVTDLLPWWWRWAGLALLVIAAAAFGAVKMHEYDAPRLEACQGDFAGYRAQVAAEGRIAQRRADADAAAAKLAKEQTDAENRRARDSDRRHIERLRRDAELAGRYNLPAAAAAARGGNELLLCFERAEFERAGRALLGDLRGIADAGDAAAIDLASVRSWALKLDRELRQR